MINKLRKKINRFVINYNMQKSKHRHYFEFIGVPGVGKSFLFDKIKESKNYNYFFFNAEFLTQKTTKLNNDIIECPLELKEHILNGKFNYVNSLKIPTSQKVWLLSYFYEILIKDQKIIKNLSCSVVAEEGLFHNFNDELLSYIQENPKILTHEYFRNRSFVFCFADPIVSARRVLDRKMKTGKLLPFFVDLNINEIAAIQNERQVKKRQLIKLIRSHKLDVLEIDTTSDVAINTNKIIDFIKK
jgi:hypothetical protein